MHQKKIICFDFDGTLVDSSVFVHSSLIKTAQDFGHSEINDNNLEEYFGPTEIGILKKILGPEEAIAASPYFYRIYTELQDTLLEENTEITELLHTLKKNPDIKLFLLTGRSRETLDISLSYLGYEGIFEKMYTGSEDGNEKGESMEELLKDYDVENEEVLYIGDTIADIEEMRRVEVDIFTAAYFSDEEKLPALKENNGEHIAYTVKDLKRMIEEVI